MKIVQITDLHFVPPGSGLHGLDPRARLDAAVADVNAHHGDALACVLSGDLAHEGRIPAYENLRDCISALRVPVHLMVGNHDDRDAMRSVFPEAACDADGFVQQVVDLPEGRLILLDTVEAGEKWGRFCERRAAWLRARLEEDPRRPAYLFLHHPPFDSGIPSLDRIRLRDGSHLAAVLRDFDCVRHLFFGHVHRPMAGSWHGIPYSALRGTNHGVPFDFEHVDQVPKSHEPPAYAVAWLRAEEVVVHYHDFLDRSALPMPA